MGKKSHRSKYTSKGERSNVASNTLRLARQAVDPFTKMLNIRKAWKAGKNPKILVDNGQEGSNRRFQRVSTNSEWGDPRGRPVITADGDAE